jgi:hypothetical protein
MTDADDETLPGRETSVSKIQTSISEFTAFKDSDALIKENRELFLMDTYYKELIIKEREAF